MTTDVLVSLSTSHSTTVYFGADASAPCLCWKDAARYWFNIKKSRHMAGNSSTADIGCIRCWWDRLSPQWELLSQLGIISLLGQHFDIDQVPGMTCMKTIKKIKLFWKHMINHVFSRDFYSRMVLFTCRILIGSIVRYGVTCKLKASSGLTEVSIFRHSISTVEMRSNHNYLCECIS